MTASASWKPYETLGWPRQQAMLEAAAKTLKLIIDGQIQPRGTLGHLLSTEPDMPVFDGDPPYVDHWKLAMAELSAVIESAQRDPAIARSSSPSSPSVAADARPTNAPSNY